MTRRDRAALRLAYECLRYRRGMLARAVESLYCGGVSARGIGASANQAAAARWFDATAERIVAARLALYLRALLRADAGDCGGRWQCRKCGRIDFAPGGCNDNSWCADDDMLWEQRIHPLWEAAPPTRPR